jgi:hypothetical protein
MSCLINSFASATLVAAALGLTVTAFLTIAATLGGKGYFGHWQTRARSTPVVYFVR